MAFAINDDLCAVFRQLPFFSQCMPANFGLPPGKSMRAEGDW